MVDTNIRLLTRKIEALDAEAQHAVEIAVDSLLGDPSLLENSGRDARIGPLERRVDALGGRNGSADVVVLDELDGELPELKSAIERLIDESHRALSVLVSESAVSDALR